MVTDPQALAARIADAAGLIRVNGHYTDHDFWPRAHEQDWAPGLPLDITAAVYVAQGVTTYRGIIAACTRPGAVRHPDVDPAIDALLAYLGYTQYGRIDDALHAFWIWEDHASPGEVVAVMEQCAAALRTGVAA
jgi:hypothetical protein